jgi:hypothetical protein
VKKAHDALLDEIQTVLDRDRDSTGFLTPEKAKNYLQKMEALMRGEIGDREWQLHEALKSKVSP